MRGYAFHPRGDEVVRAAEDTDGSVLLEVVVGIALLATLGASAAGFHAAALGADARAQARLAATLDVRELLEMRAGFDHVVEAPSHAGESARGLTVQTTLIDVDDVRCGRPRPLIGLQASAAEPAVVLSGLPAPRSRTSLPIGSTVTGGVVPVGPPGALTTTVDGLMLSSGDATAYAVALAGGCATLSPLSPGRHVLQVADDDATLIDTTHRPALQAPLSLHVLDVPLRRGWDVVAAAELSVTVDLAGARAPDGVSSGALRWGVRGDDLRDLRDLGGRRAVRPGTVVAVVTACMDPEAPASIAAVELAGASSTDIAVPLATITVLGVASWPGDTLLLARTTACADGTGLRPTLRWDGGLHDGMRIALPHGEWEGRVQTAAGARITAPVRFAASDVEATVSFP